MKLKRLLNTKLANRGYRFFSANMKTSQSLVQLSSSASIAQERVKGEAYLNLSNDDAQIKAFSRAIELLQTYDYTQGTKILESIIEQYSTQKTEQLTHLQKGLLIQAYFHCASIYSRGTLNEENKALDYLNLALNIDPNLKAAAILREDILIEHAPFTEVNEKNVTFKQ